MCPIPPNAVFKEIAENLDLSQEMRDATPEHLDQEPFQATVKDTVTKLALASPSIGKPEFACSIYSMKN